MKKKLVLMLVAISVIAMLVTLAAAPAGQKSVRLLGVHFSKNQLMLKFEVAGFTKRTDLHGSITVDKVNYPIKCTYNDPKHLTCIAPKMSKYNGLPARVWVAGFAFYTQVPFR